MDSTIDAKSGTDTTYGTVSFLSSQGFAVEAPVTHLTRHQVVFTLHNTEPALRTSELLPEFKVRLHGQDAYAGRAVVKLTALTGSQLSVEATLEEGWLESAVPSPNPATLRTSFTNFLAHWQKLHRVDSAFKMLVADMQMFLIDLRLWLEQIEMGVRSAPAGDQAQLEEQVARGLSPHTTGAIDNFFQRFEELARGLEPELRPLHRAFARRQLHPLLLCAPFLYRTYQKPLGYAGDYEMVNMICRNSFEGPSLFAKLVNYWFLQQPPAEAHRNRLDYLGERIAEVTVSAAGAGRTARILTLGCGPAHEIQRFIEQKSFSDRAHFTLLDFNEETLLHTRSRLDQIKRQYHRTTQITTTKKSVNLILKEASRTSTNDPGPQYDLVYCAGLFDYLTGQMCQRLSDILFDWVQPGGRLITTNVDASNPRRHIMDFVMDWHLIYRTGAQLSALRPERASPEACVVKSDLTGVNIYFETRKPDRA
jgi:extracellular factor (EF) 3-hydroxypalmitic acid methyl ester biosynthesis protein